MGKIRKKLFLVMALALGMVSSLTGCSTVSGGKDSTFAAVKDTGFPNWNNPDPSAYSWTLPDNSHWWNFGQNVSQDVLSFIANTLLELIAWVLHLAILVASKFSDPTWITDPVTAKVATVFKNGYEDVFMKFLPVLIMIVVGYLAWKYVVAHHAKMLTGIVSTILASGLIAFFFFDFGTAFQWIDGAGNLVTNTAASAVASAAGTPVGSEYDALWNNYITYPWEYGQFGQFSGNLAEFNVSTAFCPAGMDKQTADAKGFTWCEYTPDPTPQTPDPGDNSAVINSDPKNPDNWVKLFLHNTSQNARKTLEQDLQDAVNEKTTASPFASSNLNTAAISNANPYLMIPFLFIEGLLLITPLIFLVYVGFQLFVRELLFILTIMMGLVTVPMAFIPEIGWRITFNWIREAVGHQVERVSNAVYAALLFSVAGIITTSTGTTEASMMLAFLIDAILFAAALMYRQKVFNVAVHPLSDAARGVDTNQRLTMDEWVAQHHEQNERHRVPEGKHGEIGKLAEHFNHMGAEMEHHLPLPHGRRSGDVTTARGSDEQPQFTLPEEKPVSGGEKRSNLASHFSNDHEGKTSKLSQVAGQLGQAARGRIKEHIDSMSHSGRPLSQEERIRAREHRARALEQQLHATAVGGLAATLRQVAARKLSDNFGNTPDDPPAAPPSTGPADQAGDKDYRRRVMVTPDGQQARTVLVDKDDQPVAYEPPVLRRDQDRDNGDGADGGQPALSDGFNVAAVPDDVPADLGGLYGERAASDKAQNDTSPETRQGSPTPSTPQNGIDDLSTISEVSRDKFEAATLSSMGQSQPRSLPPNVARLTDEREHRQQVEGRQRQQRQQRSRQSQNGQPRRVVRMDQRRANERNPRPPRN